MSTQVLLVGPRGHGGEGVYMRSLYEHPPDGVTYDVSGDFHQDAAGARCELWRERALNQIVHRAAIPDMGFRALRMRTRFDLIHVHAHPVSLRARRGIPLVMSEGSSSAVYLADYLGWDEAKLRTGYRRARRLYRLLGIDDRLLALEHVDKAYVFSHWAREINLRWGADPSKLEVIYPGFEAPAIVDRGVRPDFTLLFVGGDFERKGGFEVVEAFAALAGEEPAARLVIAGSDTGNRNPDRLVHSWVSEARRERGSALLARLTEAGRIEQHQWVDQDRLRHDLYPRADAFVMPTHAEGFGFTNVEAMSFGLPVITSTAGPAAEIVADEQSGMLVAPGDVDALTRAMLRLARDRTSARRMGERARADFERRFTRERFRQALGAFYMEVLER